MTQLFFSLFAAIAYLCWLNLKLMAITLYIIGFTSAISLAALYMTPKLLDAGMFRPYRAVREKTWYEMITSGFLHADLGHLLVNMLVLFFFGLELERLLGTGHLIALYFVGLFISSLPSLFRYRDDPRYATVGASGAVSSVLFAFILLYPTETLYIFPLPIPIPAWLFAIFYMAYSISESKRSRGRVNHEAHISGALWGIVYMLLFFRESLAFF